MSTAIAPLSLARVVEALLDTSSEAIFVLDAEQRIVGMSRLAEEWVSERAELLFGRPLSEALHFVAEEAADGAAGGIDPVSWTVDQGWDFERFDHLLVVHGDRSLPVRVGVSTIRGEDGDICGAVCALSDRTAEVETQQALQAARLHDPVTGLYSREFFERELAACDPADTGADRPYWVASIDPDRLRVVNEGAGPAAGDALLQRLAQAMRRVLRAGDILARYSGDEFALLLRPCTRDEAEARVQRLMQQARMLDFRWRDASFPSTVCVGITPLVAAACSTRRAYALAERACFAAKEHGRDQYRFVTSSEGLSEHAAEVASVPRIFGALREERFRLYCQDVVPVAEPGRAVYREMLVRMLDDDGKVVPPAQFIPGAERYFMMEAVDRWVVQSTVSMLLQQDACGVVHAVNLSGQSLSNARFRDWLLALLQAHPTVSPRLCFEITETALVRQMETLQGFFTTLVGSGARLALDDFGVGMSSFRYLSRVPAAYLKIDGSFVRHLQGNPINRHIVRAMCDVGRSAGMASIAEHVEDAAELPVLRELGVTLAQGWGVARERPLSP